MESQGIHSVLVAIIPVVKELVTLISVGGMVLGGIVPYIPQYRKISKTKDVTGFSSYVCLVLLIANILRVYFWLVRLEYDMSVYCSL